MDSASILNASDVSVSEQDAEIQALQSFLREPLSFQDSSSHFQKKMSLMTEIRRRNQVPAGFRMTNLGSSEEVVFHQVKFKYSYRRQAVEARIPHSKISYLGLPRYSLDHLVTPFLMSSGQAAMASVLMALKSSVQNCVLVAPHGLYWETAELCRQLGIEFLSSASAGQRTGNEVRVGFLDSSTLPSLEQAIKELPDVDLVIADTTCWDVQGDEICQSLTAILKQKSLVCVRSHLKLDSLGAEYGSLGSAVVLSKGPLELTNEIAARARLIGALADLDQMYPFLLDDGFQKLNSKRNWRLRAAGKNLRDQMQVRSWPAGVEPRFFEHDLFFYLEFSKVYFPSLESLKFSVLKTLLKASGFPAQEVDSFGFDFMAFKMFPNSAETETPWIFRFTSPDVNEGELSIFLQALQTWQESLKCH